MGWKICYSNSKGEDNKMIFSETKLKGSFVIQLEKIIDERGFFARSWDEEVFKKNGCNPRLVQCNVSFNNKKGTLRGLHYQEPPHQEAKLVRCTKGRIFDVIVDLRETSSTMNQWFGVELSENNNKMLYIPEGFAHGFQTLEDDSEVFYQMSEFYFPELAKGKRWNDPSFNIAWPIKVPIISEKDSKWELN